VSSPSSKIYIYLPALKKKNKALLLQSFWFTKTSSQWFTQTNYQRFTQTTTVYYGITCRSGNLTALLAMSWMKMEATISCAEVIWILGSACTKCANPCGSLVKCGGGRRDPLPPIFRSWHRLYLRRGGMQHVVFSLYSLFVTAYA
jgi:hypothetical protein